MQRSELTSQDREWLDQQAAALRLSCDFMLSDLFHRGSPDQQSIAGAVPIWFEGEYVEAIAVMRRIEERVPYSQIFEQWESRVFQDVQQACLRLSVQDARVLVVAAGFDGITEEQIFKAAGEAVDEAWNALYGEPDDSFDDDDEDVDWGTM